MAPRHDASIAGHAYKTMDSPVGRLTLVAAGDGLAAVLWEHERPGRVPLRLTEEDAAHPTLVEAEHELRDYFAGRRTRFNVKLAMSGTAFQRAVWKALLTIPFGETRTYTQIARQIGHPQAVRAVGAANGRNPWSIIAPCHRVVGANGALTGFAGGLGAKAWLLSLEGAPAGSSPPGPARRAMPSAPSSQTRRTPSLRG